MILNNKGVGMITTKISYNGELGEYRIRLFVNGAYQAGADYFTDDKGDARNTARHMERTGGISDKTTDFAKDEQSDYENECGLIIYDVCNDYSLDECSTEFNPEEYITSQHPFGTIYTHKECNEIHYLKGGRGLNGRFLF